MQDESNLYELGYLLIPQVAPEKLPDEVVSVRKAIESAGGQLVEEDSPKVRMLAYPVSRVIAHKRVPFSQAYFGWIRFQATSEQVLVVKSELEKLESMLRFLLIHAENYVRPVVRRVPPRAAGAPAVEGAAEKPKMSEEDMEREIQQLLTTTTA